MREEKCSHGTGLLNRRYCWCKLIYIDAGAEVPFSVGTLKPFMESAVPPAEQR